MLSTAGSCPVIGLLPELSGGAATGEAIGEAIGDGIGAGVGNTGEAIGDGIGNPVVGARLPLGASPVIGATGDGTTVGGGGAYCGCAPSPAAWSSGAWSGASSCTGMPCA